MSKASEYKNEAVPIQHKIDDMQTTLYCKSPKFQSYQVQEVEISTIASVNIGGSLLLGRRHLAKNDALHLAKWIIDTFADDPKALLKEWANE